MDKQQINYYSTDINLESDSYFTNGMDNRNGIDKDYFTHYAHHTMNMIYNIDRCITLCISREMIHHNKGFLRFEVLNHDPENIKQVLKEISALHIDCMYCSVKTIYNINLGLNLLLMEQRGISIDLINVEEFLYQYSDVEIDDMIYYKKMIEILSIVNLYLIIRKDFT
jgi:hypothetical protein